MKKRIDGSRALQTVMQLLKIEGVSAREAAVMKHVTGELVKSGVPRTSIVTDNASRHFPFEAESGNLIASVPGRGRLASAKPRMFSAHVDTVGLASRAKPIARGNRIATDGSTALGADNRAGVAVIVTLVRTLAKLKLDHPPLVLVFTVCEETGLWGSRYLDPRAIARCEYGFNFDGSTPSQLVVAAPSEDKFTVDILGISSHAGVAPEKGASAAVMFAKATAALSDRGWLGRVRKGKNEGTSNIGVVSGGTAMNIVPSHVRVEGEARSYSDAFLARMIGAFKKEFAAAAKKVKNKEGVSGRVEFDSQRLYNTFDLARSAGVIHVAERALESVGLKPVSKRQFGGLDANWLNAHGLPTVTLGAGGHNQHAITEYLDVREHLVACEMALRLSGANLDG